MENLVLVLIPIYIAYIIVIGFMMFKKRFSAIKEKKVSAHYFKDYQGAAPYELEVYKNHFENQFQFPLIFFILCIAFFVSKSVNATTVFLCYFFVASRFLHSYFHLGTNNLRLRGVSYLLGALSVLLLSLDYTFKNLF